MVFGGEGRVRLESALYCCWELGDLLNSVTVSDVAVSLPLSQKPLQQRHSHTQPHYRLSLGDVPFVAGTVCSLSLTHTHSDESNTSLIHSFIQSEV